MFDLKVRGGNYGPWADKNKHTNRIDCEITDMLVVDT